MTNEPKATCPKHGKDCNYTKVGGKADEAPTSFDDVVESLKTLYLDGSIAAPADVSLMEELPTRDEKRFESAWTAEELLKQAHLMLTMGPGKHDALSLSLAKRITRHLTFSSHTGIRYPRAAIGGGGGTGSEGHSKGGKSNLRL
jgi:hypothetical protein